MADKPDIAGAIIGLGKIGFNRLAGRSADGSKRPLKGANKSAEGQRQAALEKAASFDVEDHTVTKEDELREKHLNNRYLYGLNSAGVFVYLHDKSDAIDEILLLPADRIGTKLDESKVAGATGLIRPVSDERGFEVIGHFRYGRGVSLRDGSLVLQSEANAKAVVASTPALSGSLFATLQAQSAGLTTGSLFSANPAKEINTLTPEDTQTAAVITPDGKAEFKETSNFVDAAPLGSPKQIGLTNSSSVADVEASQLSRALTLAEMKAKDDTLSTDVNPDCSCLLGRSDLSFIAVGYQLRSIPSASGASDSTIEYGALDATIGADKVASSAKVREYLAGIAAAQDAAEAAVRASRDKEARINRLTTGFDAAKYGEETSKIIVTAREKAREEYKAAHSAEVIQEMNTVQLGAVADAIQDGGPLVDKPGRRSLLKDMANPKAVITRVENFLLNLYEGLDAAHQEHEKMLRGGTDTLESRVPSPEVPPQPKPNVAPPFGGPARALGGDPLALGLAGSSAVDDLAQSFETLSTELNKVPHLTAMKLEVKALEDQLESLEYDAALAEAAGDATKLGETQKLIDDTTQKLNNKKLQLNNIHGS